MLKSAPKSMMISIIAALGMVALNKVQQPVEEAFATSGVRL